MNTRATDLISYFEDRKAGILGQHKSIHFSLFLPLLYRDDQWHLLFQVRSSLVKQPGEVCFPGGRVEEFDESYAAAAQRELQEELGLQEEQATLLGELDMMVTPFQFIVHPFIGIIHDENAITPQEAEVAEVFTVPVKELISMEPKQHNIRLDVQPESGFPYHLIPNGQDYNWRTGQIKELFYDYNGRIIWGLTARILAHAIDEIKNID